MTDRVRSRISRRQEGLVRTCAERCSDYGHGKHYRGKTSLPDDVFCQY
jgi:hypothetical protein